MEGRQAVCERARVLVHARVCVSHLYKVAAHSVKQRTERSTGLSSGLPRRLLFRRLAGHL